MKHYSTTLIASVLALFSVSNALASSCVEPPITGEDGADNKPWLDFVVSTVPSRHNALFVGHLSETDKGLPKDRPEYRWVLDKTAQQASLGILGHSDVNISEAYQFVGTVLSEYERFEVTDLSITLVIHCDVDAFAACTEPLPAGREIVFTGVFYPESGSTSVSLGLCYPYFDGAHIKSQYSLEQLATAFREMRAR